jgi:hypothetical protein
LSYLDEFVATWKKVLIGATQNKGKHINISWNTTRGINGLNILRRLSSILKYRLLLFCFLVENLAIWQLRIQNAPNFGRFLSDLLQAA